MSNFYGIDSNYKVFENPVSDKVVVSTVKDGIDELEMAKKIREAKIMRTKLDEKKVSTDAKKLTALDALGDLMSKFNQSNFALGNFSGTVDNPYPNVFKNLVSNSSSINGVNAENYVTANAEFNQSLLGSQFTVSVTQLAKNDLLQSTSSISAPSAAQNLDGNLYINGTAIALTATDTMTDIVRKINALSSTTGVTAYTAEISPANSNVNLFLQATNIAVPIDITPDAGDPLAIDPTASLFLPAASQYNGNAGTIAAYTQTLQAAIVMNGTTYYRETNTVSDLINGVTLTLTNSMPVGTSTTISFNMDTDSIVEATVNWIEAFNNVKTFLKTHLQKAKDDDPNGLHALFRNPIVEKTIRLINQINLGVNGLTNQAGTLGQYSIAFQTAGDASSTLIYDTTQLTQSIKSNPLQFLQTMGQNFTSTNPKVNLLTMPAELPAVFANSPLTLTISNTHVNMYGETVYNANLSYGSYLEALEDISGNIITFTDPSNFDGFSFLYDGTPPPIGTSEILTINVTQGIAAGLNGDLTTYLQEPFNISLAETLPLSDLSVVDWGDLSQQIFLIYKEKQQIEKVIEAKVKQADNAYESAVSKLQKFNNQADKTKQIRDMINYISTPKH